MNEAKAKNLKNIKILINESNAHLSCSIYSENQVGFKLNTPSNRCVTHEHGFKLKESISGNFACSMVNLGLSLELALKALIIINQINKSKPSFPHDHDLLNLFGNLNKKHKKIIQKKFSSSKIISNRRKQINDINKTFKKLGKDEIIYPGGLMDALISSRSIFTDWRYIHEDKKKGDGDLLTLRVIHKILIDILNDEILIIEKECNNDEN